MPNYDVLTDKEGYLGTRIVTKPPSKAYQDGWDLIDWSKKSDLEEKKQEEVKLLQK